MSQRLSLNSPQDVSSFQTSVQTHKQLLASELQSQGIRMVDEAASSASRRGGAGPSDHKAITLLGTTIMVPIHTRPAHQSIFTADPPDTSGKSMLYRNGVPEAPLQFPPQPKFYGLSTADGIPYWKIGQLHSHNVLATTVLQTCIRYGNSDTKCQFCALGESLRAGRTISKKSPAQLAEVAEAAMRLDGVEQVVLTTGTPPTEDRGAAVLVEVAQAIKERTGLAIQAQCEPPADFVWFERLKVVGVDSLGMHLEAWSEHVRARIMPGKAQVPVSFYLKAFEAAVAVFGRGQVSTYLLAGLGDTVEELLEGSWQLIARGVYPFVVPFVPISGTPLQNQTPPTAEFMRAVLEPLGNMLRTAGMTSDTVKAGCAKCGACSSLSTFEKGNRDALATTSPCAVG
ncbi:MSMEG_0568 family radical SAM protein [Roseimicrobium sp. ORNL1]|uniref:MSMEG_0568 family radical SAM protein n=1 Tax=Roseimicrobium sp. ORNL1 TaxID=2711231 RepID=UPI0013E0F6B3|nr:MSMEG_0568 family radical SAM protein [Roseimicrobium sp. ORNL1]QIF01122.1 MSMEG_0568 family radical SAM protein [Roseimicrobium sp. ORNL1]